MPLPDLADFSDESIGAKEIAINRLPGWEYRLTAELLRDYLRDPLRRWRDLADGVYIPERRRIGDEAAIHWLTDRMNEMSDIFGPLEKLTPRFARAWGEPGQEGDAADILHTCKLLKRGVDRAIKWEEEIAATLVPDRFLPLFALLPGTIGSQIEKLSNLPASLSELLAWAEAHPGQSRILSETIIFEAPEGWTERVTAEVDKLTSPPPPSSIIDGWQFIRRKS